jgi:uncharacterized protein (TIGR03086 family)
MLNLQPAAERLGALVGAVRDDQLGLPTPCPDYTVGDLLDHIAGVAIAFAEAAAKEQGINVTPPPLGDRSRLADDWRTRIPRDLTACAAAWRDSQAWEGNTWIGGAEMPASVVGRVGIDELVVHGWDVARATGQPFDADAETIAGCLEFIETISQPGMEAARAPAFGPVADNVDEQPSLDRVLALSGRDPRWSPEGTAGGR